MKTNINISEKYFFHHPSDLKAMEEVLNIGKLSGKSKIIGAYEEDLAHYFGVKNAVAVSSGSTALHAALHGLGVTASSEVIVAATAPIPTVLPILCCQAKPVLVDVMPGSFDMDYNDVERKITAKTKAVIVVPNWGYPQDYTELLKVLNKKNIPLIEDAAQAHFSRRGNKFIGTFGYVGCFSTHDKKLLSTGEGGFILTEDAEFAKKIRTFVQLGGMTGVNFGVNYKLSGTQAALGKNRLRLAEEGLQTRKRNAKTIIEKIKNTPIKEIAYPSDGFPNYYALVLTINDPAIDSQHFINWLVEQGIPSDFKKYGIKPLYKYPLFKEPELRCPNVEHLFENTTTVPVHPGVSEEQIDYISDRINHYLTSN